MAKRERRADPNVWEIRAVVNFCNVKVEVTTTMQSSYGSPGVDDVQTHIKDFLVEQINDISPYEIWFNAGLREEEEADVEEENFVEHEANLPSEPEVEDFPGGSIAICPVEPRSGWEDYDCRVSGDRIM